jgi:predicted nucleic acid-binding protein
MIVDTSFVLDVIDDVDAAITKTRELEAAGVPLVIPAMTVLELYIGIGKVANTPAERHRVEAVLDSYLDAARESRHSRRA